MVNGNRPGFWENPGSFRNYKSVPKIEFFELTSQNDTLLYNEFLNEIKVRFKMSETNCKILNIFANSHVIHEISIVMDSKYYVDNFQPVFVAKTAKFYMKK